MFYYIKGTLVAKELQFVAVDSNGVAFKCYTSATTLQNIGSVGSEVLIYTYMSVKEDGIDLFGFADEKELECFKMLISVSGVGPKAALSVLSAFTPEALSSAIANSDSKSITRSNGVGPKIAQRIVLELKNKMMFMSDGDDDVSPTGVITTGTNVAEAVSALEFLGYSHQEAVKAVRETNPDSSVEDMIKEALTLLSGGI